jgi:hypothetical protein
MTFDLKANSDFCNIRKLTHDFSNFDGDPEDQLKIPSRGRKLNDYYLNSCENSCKNTACDSSGIYFTSNSYLDVRIKNKPAASRPMPVTLNRISRAQKVESRSLSKRRSRPSKRETANIPKKNKIDAKESKKAITDYQLLKMKQDIEENISLEIEKILAEIYSNNIYGKNYDIRKYDNYVFFY